MQIGVRSIRLLAMCVVAAVGSALCLLSPVWAQAYPARAITMIVPFPAGGPTDAVARIVAERMRGPLGQPVVIENIAGASGSLGVGRAARAAADGYTLCFGTWSTHVVNGAILSLPYDVINDFEPVALISSSPIMIVGKRTLPARDLKELIAWLRANPDKALSGTPGVASAAQLAGVLFQTATDTHFRFVPYKGVGPAMQDLVAGRIDLIFDLVADATPQIHAGTIKAYAVLAHDRSPIAADVPAASEAGWPGLTVSSWQGIWVPKGTSQAVIAKVNAAVVDALSDPTVRQRLIGLAQEIPPPAQLTPAALGDLQKAEIAKWWPIIRKAGMKAQ